MSLADGNGTPASNKKKKTTKTEDDVDGGKAPPDRVKEERRKTLMEELKRTEVSIYELEQSYLQDSLGGNAVRGWRVDSRGRPSLQSSMEDDMVFSQSSVTSPAFKKSKQTSKTD